MGRVKDHELLATVFFVRLKGKQRVEFFFLVILALDSFEY